MWHFFLSTLVFFAGIFYFPIDGIEVCDNFESYYYPNDKHCYNDTDGESNVTEIVKRWGFTAEEYKVDTKDGYQILIVRIYQDITQDTPIVLGHGLEENSLRFVIQGKKSLGYFLGNKGFDVWLVNFRGTIYSKGHANLTSEDLAYWKFSFTELGYYDLYSTFEKVNEKTGKKAIYIGDSNGANAGLVYAIKQSEKSQKHLSGMILFGPMAYMDNVKSYLKFIAPIFSLVKPALDQNLKGRIPDNDFHKVFCSRYPFQMYFCEFIRSFLFGMDFEQMDPSDYPLIQVMNGDSVPFDTLEHYAQLMKCKKFIEMDFGKEMNYQKYGQATPPIFMTSEIAIPVTIKVGVNDWLATVSNAKHLYDEIPKNSQCGFYQIKYDKFNHADYQQAKDVVSLLYEPTLGAINTISKGNCSSVQD